MGWKQAWIVKTDASGNKQWDKTVLTNPDNKVPAFAIQTNDDCYAVAKATYGHIAGDKTQPSWGSSDYWIVKFCDSTLTTPITQLPNAQLPFSIFPNPTTGTIQLTYNTKHNAPLQCEIINVMGETVFKSEIVNPASQINLDVSFLAKGIYVVRVGDGEKWENKKLVVE